MMKLHGLAISQTICFIMLELPFDSIDIILSYTCDFFYLFIQATAYQSTARKNYKWILIQKLAVYSRLQFKKCIQKMSTAYYQFI